MKKQTQKVQRGTEKRAENAKKAKNSREQPRQALVLLRLSRE
jgi:hypothetical protein